eukprot:1194504-Prorocentrum_minimum.AAC.3
MWLIASASLSFFPSLVSRRTHVPKTCPIKLTHGCFCCAGDSLPCEPAELAYNLRPLPDILSHKGLSTFWDESRQKLSASDGLEPPSTASNASGPLPSHSTGEHSTQVRHTAPLEPLPSSPSVSGLSPQPNNDNAADAAAPSSSYSSSDDASASSDEDESSDDQNNNNVDNNNDGDGDGDDEGEGEGEGAAKKSRKVSRRKYFVRRPKQSSLMDRMEAWENMIVRPSAASHSALESFQSPRSQEMLSKRIKDPTSPAFLLLRDTFQHTLDSPGRSAGLCSLGAYSPGLYSLGVYSPGLYPLGVYSPGLYPLGLCSLVVYSPGLYSLGLCSLGVVFSRPVFTGRVFTWIVSTRPVFTGRVFTWIVSTRPVFTRRVFTWIVFTRPVFTSRVFTWIVSTRPVFTSRVFTWLIRGSHSVQAVTVRADPRVRKSGHFQQKLPALEAVREARTLSAALSAKASAGRAETPQIVTPEADGAMGPYARGPEQVRAPSGH